MERMFYDNTFVYMDIIIFYPAIYIFNDEFCCSRVIVTFTLDDRMISNH